MTQIPVPNLRVIWQSTHVSNFLYTKLFIKLLVHFHSFQGNFYTWFFFYWRTPVNSNTVFLLCLKLHQDLFLYIFTSLPSVLLLGSTFFGLYVVFVFWFPRTPHSPCTYINTPSDPTLLIPILPSDIGSVLWGSPGPSTFVPSFHQYVWIRLRWKFLFMLFPVFFLLYFFFTSLVISHSLLFPSISHKSLCLSDYVTECGH